MSIENPFIPEKENIKHLYEQNDLTVPETLLSTYLEAIRNSQPDPAGLKERSEALAECRSKIEAKVKNDFNESLANEMRKYGFWEDVGYYPAGQELPLGDYPKHFGEGYVLNRLPVMGAQNESIGQNLYREKKDLTQEDRVIKAEVIEAYNRLSAAKWFYVEREINSQHEKNVRNGAMAYLGEKTFEEYVDMIKNGLPTERVENVPIFDEGMNPLDLSQKVYAWIK